MKKPIYNQVRFEVTTWKREKMTTRSLTLKQVQAINLRAFCFCYAVCLRVLGYQDSKGIWQDINSKNKGIGPNCWQILQALQLNAGVGLDKGTLIELTGLWNLDKKGVLAQRIRALRAAFGETKETERLIITSTNSGFTVMWPKKSSWIWVILLP